MTKPTTTFPYRHEGTSDAVTRCRDVALSRGLAAFTAVELKKHLRSRPSPQP